MRHRFDLVVIGTGTAAGVVAHTCRRAGWSVAVIDSRPFGGTCALRGCDPKRVLVGVVEALDQVNRLRGKGVRADAIRVEWSELMRFKRGMIEAVPAAREDGFARAGIETFHGRARFEGRNVITVGDHVLEGRRLLIAAGAKPADLGIEGREHLVTSEQFLEIDVLPPRVLFVGGGYISFEFGHVAARAGAKVTVINQGARPLNAFDPDLVDLLVARSLALGIDVRLGAVVTRTDKAGTAFTVHAEAQGIALQFEAEMVVHGAGRVPEIDDLNLDVAGVTWDRQGVTVNEHLQSVSNPAVYAAGDAAASGAPRLTPVADYHGRIVATNLLDEKNPQSPDHTVVPSVVFTIPPLASVGLLESVARHRGLAFDVRHGDTVSWNSSRRVGETHSGFKVLVEKPSGRILGAHVLGPHADDVINIFAMAMRAGGTASSLKEILFAYPTAGSDISYMV
jgi:glutathione reductase (NADPH)